MMPKLLTIGAPLAGGFIAGWATRQQLAEATRTCMLRGGFRKKGLFAGTEGQQQEERQEEKKMKESGSWCSCSSVAVMHRLFLSSQSLEYFASTVRTVAKSLTETRGFKSMSVLKRPLKSSSPEPLTAADLSKAAAAAVWGEEWRPPQRRGAELLVIEEWLDPVAAKEALDRQTEKKEKKGREETMTRPPLMRGTLLSNDEDVEEICCIRGSSGNRISELNCCFLLPLTLLFCFVRKS
ncbi:hypothetical protein Efla_004887 [Eimeria flavescens]